MVAKKEIEKLERKLERYTVSSVGSIEEDKKVGRCRFLYNQMNNASTKVVWGIKMEMVHILNVKYQMDGDLFNWFNQDLENVKCVAACNDYDKARTSRHQPGGTAIAVREAMTQYLCKFQVQRQQRTKKVLLIRFLG